MENQRKYTQREWDREVGWGKVPHKFQKEILPSDTDEETLSSDTNEDTYRWHNLPFSWYGC